jgi:hypothetical protein
MRATVAIIVITVAAGLAVYLALERQAALKLNQENEGLRQLLSEMDELAAENRRLSNLVAEMDRLPARPERAATGEMSAPSEKEELVRLRGEVEGLREQTKEIENLRANTPEAGTAAETTLKTRGNQAADGQFATTANASQLEVLSADYGTDRTNLDVSAELRARIRGDSLKAMASNNLKGDPDFGQVKHLTVVYRFGGVTMTNEFREGDVIILPKEQQP